MTLSEVLRNGKLVCFATGLIGCATAAEPMVSMHQDSSLSRYTLLEVPPVTDESGQKADFDPASVVTEELRSQLAVHGLTVAADDTTAGSDALIVKSSLIAYNPGNPAKAWVGMASGSAEATVKTTLIDKKSGDVIGTMITPQNETAGLYGYAIPLSRLVLKSVAKGIADDLSKRIGGS